MKSATADYWSRGQGNYFQKCNSSRRFRDYEMKQHEQTKITIEMESANGALGDIYIDVKCWDKNKATKLSREEMLLIVSSICERVLKCTNGGKK